ncbi:MULTISPECIES: SusC/RagA family TonB-linked outer membrane protein [Arenibacter]|uniref:SusC/RagA family TonB-linked outer membrane protein n=1 Tax=Arenibacter TaxID=178469 RepID=UPI00068A3D75|nr:MULTISPECIES: SusC/RagA family TonB-linked outer membrane protein [Arenibacter]GBF18055.1 tonB-dependent Receptor Plug Domain protein [Arenibacter sp. NBRC 103722]
MKNITYSTSNRYFVLSALRKTIPINLPLIIFCFLTSGLFAQETITVNGSVSDSQGVPLPGVSIVQKGTTNGVTTDFDGQYSINAPSNATLIYTYIGMSSQEIQINGRQVVNVGLQESTESLDEVVVVGFGTQSRSLMSSSVSKIKQTEIQNSPAVNPVQLLQGKVAGLSVNVDSGQPGSGAAVYIRGGTQTDPRSGANEPLYIIDGVFREDLNGVSPSDIKSIEVLKDAASTAIYGARAANGVILVTTVTGKESGKGRINIRYSTGVDQQAKDYNWTSVEDYLRVSRLAAQKGVSLNSPGARLTNANFGYSVQELSEKGEFGFERIALTYLDDLTSLEGQAYVDGLLANGYRTMTDPVTGRELIFIDNKLNEIRVRSAITHDINVGMSGSSEMGNYNISAGYLDQEGVVIGTGATRFNTLMNGTFNINNNLAVNGQFTYQFNDIDQPRSTNNTINRSSRLPHTYRIWNDDGTPALGESTGSPRNIFHELYYQDDERKQFRTSSKIGLDWNIIKGLSFSPSASVYRLESNGNLFERASREVTNRAMSRFNDTQNQVMLDGLLKYTNTFNEKHNLDVLLGTQYVKNHFESFSGSGSNAPTDLISTLNASETERERVTSDISTNKLMSFFGKLDYNFARKYLVGFSIRRDGSSRFSENNRFGIFPAVSAGWNLHQEEFWKSDLLSKVKIRGSWGKAGNDNLALSDTQGGFSSTSYALGSAVRISKLPNLNLKWETTTQTNIGLDLGIAKDRFNILIDYYNKVTSDRLLNMPLPAQTGFSSIRSNFGSLTNQGVEMELSGTIIAKENFSWNLAGNLAYNKSEVTKLPDNEFDKNRNGGLIIWDENGNETRVGGLAEGERPNGVWAYEMIGVYATDEEAANAPDDQVMSGYYRSQYGGAKNGGDAIWKDVNGDNIIDSRDQVFMGYVDPNFRGGMVNTISYKGLSLRLVQDWATGHVIWNNFRARSNANSRNNVVTNTDVLSDAMWKEQGDIATLPRYDNASGADNGPGNHHRQSNIYTKKGDYLSFREVSLSYSFPKDISSKLGMSNTSLGLEFYNLGYITQYDGLTPEQFDGTDEGIYPRPFQIRLRLNASF